MDNSPWLLRCSVEWQEKAGVHTSASVAPGESVHVEMRWATSAVCGSGARLLFLFLQGVWEDLSEVTAIQAPVCVCPFQGRKV